MKKLLIINLCFPFICMVSYAQDTTNNFQIVQGEIIWEKIYNTKLSFAEVSEHLKVSGLLDKIEIRENKVYGELKGLDADFKGAGFSEMTTPMYIARSRFTGFLTLEYKEGRYRVVLRKIVLIQKNSDSLSNQGEITSLESYGLNSKGQIANFFKKTPGFILDHTFSKKFDFNLSTNNGEW